VQIYNLWVKKAKDTVANGKTLATKPSTDLNSGLFGDKALCISSAGRRGWLCSAPDEARWKWQWILLHQPCQPLEDWLGFYQLSK
jgi:hypothetical protein